MHRPHQHDSPGTTAVGSTAVVPQRYLDHISPDLAECERIIHQHNPADGTIGRCEQCPETGWCDLLRWAEFVVLTDGLPHPHT